MSSNTSQHHLAAARTASGEPHADYQRLSTKQLGDLGEQLAADHLENHGQHVVARNWRCAEGELDLVTLDGNVLAAVEVKTRRSTRYGSPLDAINHHKARRLRKLLMVFVRDHEIRVQSVRIDAVAIVMPTAGSNQTAPEIAHFRGVA